MKKMLIIPLVCAMLFGACATGENNAATGGKTTLRMLMTEMDRGESRWDDFAYYMETYTPQIGCTADAGPAVLANHTVPYLPVRGLGDIAVQTVPTGMAALPYGTYPNAAGIAASYFDDVALKLLAGDDDFDMFLIGMESYMNATSQFSMMLNKNYFLPMEALGLESLFDSMLPGVKDICTADGAILLAPVRLSYWGVVMQPLVLARLGIVPEDIPRTANAFTDFFLNVRDRLESEEIALFSESHSDFLIRQFEGQYISAYMSHAADTQALWDAMLDTLDKLYGAGLVPLTARVLPDGGAADFAPAFPYTTAVFDSFRRITGSGLDEELMPNQSPSDRRMENHVDPVLPHLLLTEDAKAPLYGGVFIAVNPNSKNLDAVRDFLTTILSEDFRHSFNIEQDLWELYENADNALRNDYAVYREAVAHSAMSPVFSRYYRGEYINHTDYAAYRTGTLSAAEWKAKVDRELEFLRDE